MHFAYAVVRDDPPKVYVAESLDVLNHVLALEVVSATPGSFLAVGPRERLREALLAERWGDAVSEWIDQTDTPVDVYDDLEVWTAMNLADPELRNVELQFRPLFNQ